MEKPDRRDVHAYGGLVLIGLGAAAYHWAVGVAVVGLALFYIGVWRMG